MKAKFNNSIFTVLSMTLLMACSSTRNATAQYPNDGNDDYGNYQNNDNYNNDDAYNNDDGNYEEPSESDVSMNVFVDGSFIGSFQASHIRRQCFFFGHKLNRAFPMRRSR